MTFLRNTFFYLVFYLWTTIFFVIFSPVKFFTRKFAVYLSKKWTDSVMILCKIILKIDYSVIGNENIPKNESFVVASNHQSAWETFFFVCLFDNPVFILKKELNSIPIFSWYFKKLDFILIDRNNSFQAVKHIIESIREQKPSKRAFIIFPEGTRIPPNDKGVINPGVFAVHKLLKIPIVVLKHDSGKYWKNKEYLKSQGTIKVKIYPKLRNYNKKEFLKKLETYFY